MIDIYIKEEEQGLALIELLQRRIPAAPPSYLKQLLKKGKVQADGEPVSANAQLPAGTVIALPESARLQELLSAPPPVESELQILYESREILIIDKPAGLAVHSSEGHETDNLTARVEQLLKTRGSKFQLAPVHRLDLETSGPLLFGKGKQACGRLGQLFMQQQVEKSYLALVAGRTAGSGELHSQLKAKGKQKLAHTSYVARQRSEQASLLELTLHTGRQHQIRLQLSELGHPLFGDQRYRGPCPSELPRMFLHCHRLAFVDPFSGAPLAIESPLPDELTGFLANCGLVEE